VANLFNVSGKGNIAGGRWNYYLEKWQDIEQRVFLGLDYRAYQNNVLLGGVGFVPDITVHPVSLGYAGVKRMTASELSFNGLFASNIPGGNDGGQANFDATRTGATSYYNLLRAGINFAHAFRNDWQSRVGLTGQYTDDLLIPGEQFGIGGMDTVRGYLPREVAADKGYAAQLEVYTPNFADSAGLNDKWRSRVVGFYDYGNVRNNDPLPGELTSQSLASTGLGLRMSYGKSVILRFDVAQILRAFGTRETSDQRIAASLAVIY